MKTKIALGMLVCLITTSHSFSADSSLPISSIVFDDDAFGACVLTKAEDEGWTNTAQVTSLDCSYKGVDSTLGLELLLSLTDLNLTFNNITSIDVSSLLALEALSVGYNDLTTLDVSANVNLESLYAYGNLLSSITLDRAKT